MNRLFFYLNNIYNSISMKKDCDDDFKEANKIYGNIYEYLPEYVEKEIRELLGTIGNYIVSNYKDVLSEKVIAKFKKILMDEEYDYLTNVAQLIVDEGIQNIAKILDFYYLFLEDDDLYPSCGVWNAPKNLYLYLISLCDMLKKNKIEYHALDDIYLHCYYHLIKMYEEVKYSQCLKEIIERIENCNKKLNYSIDGFFIKALLGNCYYFGLGVEKKL